MSRDLSVAPTVVLACGALAREIAALIPAERWPSVQVRYLPPELHNRPEQIVPSLERLLADLPRPPGQLLVAYAECGTQGELDAFLQRVRHRHGIPVERLAGAHCYEAYAGEETFAALADQEPGTFYLTDFLVRHFEPLVWRGLGLDRYPRLQSVYFAHYRRVVYLAQAKDPLVLARARRIAERLGLAFELRFTGHGELARLLHERQAPDRPPDPSPGR